MKGSSYSLRVMKNAKVYHKSGLLPESTLKNTFIPSKSCSLDSSPTESDNKQCSSQHPYVPRSASGRPGGKPLIGRGHVKHIKGKKGKNGKKDQYDLIVNIDLKEWQLSDEQVAEFKEVFMLFDKDEDGVLTFPELGIVMKSLGQRPSETDLLTMVRDVSEDTIYDTIEFNEFLQMMSKQQRFDVNEDSLNDAFKIFDKDDDGFLSVDDLRIIMQCFGDKMMNRELDEMIAEADSEKNGRVNYEKFVKFICAEDKKKKKKKDKHSYIEDKENIINIKMKTKEEILYPDKKVEYLLNKQNENFIPNKKTSSKKKIKK